MVRNLSAAVNATSEFEQVKYHPDFDSTGGSSPHFRDDAAVATSSAGQAKRFQSVVIRMSRGAAADDIAEETRELHVFERKGEEDGAGKGADEGADDGTREDTDQSTRTSSVGDDTTAGREQEQVREAIRDQFFRSVASSTASPTSEHRQSLSPRSTGDRSPQRRPGRKNPPEQQSPTIRTRQRRHNSLSPGRGRVRQGEPISRSERQHSSHSPRRVSKKKRSSPRADSGKGFTNLEGDKAVDARDASPRRRAKKSSKKIVLSESDLVRRKRDVEDTATDEAIEFTKERYTRRKSREKEKEVLVAGKTRQVSRESQISPKQKPKRPNNDSEDDSIASLQDSIDTSSDNESSTGGLTASKERLRSKRRLQQKVALVNSKRTAQGSTRKSGPLDPMSFLDTAVADAASNFVAKIVGQINFPHSFFPTGPQTRDPPIDPAYDLLRWDYDKPLGGDKVSPTTMTEDITTTLFQLLSWDDKRSDTGMSSHQVERTPHAKVAPLKFQVPNTEGSSESHDSSTSSDLGDSTDSSTIEADDDTQENDRSREQRSGPMELENSKVVPTWKIATADPPQAIDPSEIAKVVKAAIESEMTNQKNSIRSDTVARNPRTSPKKKLFASRPIDVDVQYATTATSEKVANAAIESEMTNQENSINSKAVARNPKASPKKKPFTSRPLHVDVKYTSTTPSNDRREDKTANERRRGQAQDPDDRILVLDVSSDSDEYLQQQNESVPAYEVLTKIDDDGNSLTYSLEDTVNNRKFLIDGDKPMMEKSTMTVERSTLGTYPAKVDVSPFDDRVKHQGMSTEKPCTGAVESAGMPKKRAPVASLVARFEKELKLKVRTQLANPKPSGSSRHKGRNWLDNSPKSGNHELAVALSLSGDDSLLLSPENGEIEQGTEGECDSAPEISSMRHEKSTGAQVAATTSERTRQIGLITEAKEVNTTKLRVAPMIPENHRQELEAKIKEFQERRATNTFSSQRKPHQLQHSLASSMPATRKTTTKNHSSALAGASVVAPTKTFIAPDAPIMSKHVARGCVQTLSKQTNTQSSHAKGYVEALSKGGMGSDDSMPGNIVLTREQSRIIGRNGGYGRPRMDPLTDIVDDLSTFQIGHVVMGYDSFASYPNENLKPVDMDDLVSRIDSVVQRLIEKGKLPGTESSPTESSDLQTRTLRNNTAELLRNLSILRSRRPAAPDSAQTQRSSIPSMLDSGREPEPSNPISLSDGPPRSTTSLAPVEEIQEPRQPALEAIEPSIAAMRGDGNREPSPPMSNLARIRARRDDAAKRIKQQAQKLAGFGPAGTLPKSTPLSAFNRHDRLPQKTVAKQRHSPTPTKEMVVSTEAALSESRTPRNALVEQAPDELPKKKRKPMGPPRPEDASIRLPRQPEIISVEDYDLENKKSSPSPLFSSSAAERTDRPLASKSKSTTSLFATMPSGGRHSPQAVPPSASDIHMREWEKKELTQLPLILNPSRTDHCDSRDEHDPYSPRQLQELQRQQQQQQYRYRHSLGYLGDHQDDKGGNQRGELATVLDHDLYEEDDDDDDDETDTDDSNDEDSMDSETDSERLDRISGMIEELRVRRRSSKITSTRW